MSSLQTAKPGKKWSATLSTRNIVLCGMFAAILAVMSQISIPMPTGMPITIQVFGITLLGVVLGWRLGILSTLVYILLGAAGLPIFANFQGGIRVIVGITGGYIISWPLMVFLCGIRPKTANRTLHTFFTIVLALLGLAVNELAGILQWAALSGDMTFGAVFTYAMVAFIPKDIVLTVLAVLTGIQVRKILSRSGAVS